MDDGTNCAAGVADTVAMKMSITRVARVRGRLVFLFSRWLWPCAVVQAQDSVGPPSNTHSLNRSKLLLDATATGSMFHLD